MSTYGCTSRVTQHSNPVRDTSPSSLGATAPTSGTTKASEYLDGLAGLFVVQIGHGRTELAEVMAKQANELAFFPLWSYAHPAAIDLADRLAELAPGDLNRVFFTSGGGEAVESAWKLAKQYFKLTGQAHEAQGDQPFNRLPRHAARRAVDHRHPRRQEVLRTAWCLAR